MSSQILLIYTLNPIVEVFSYLWFPALSQVSVAVPVLKGFIKSIEKI